MKRALLVVVLLLLAFVSVTGWALESAGVAVVETRRPDGSTRSTHVWYAANKGELWLEAGAPGNSWFEDIQTSPRVVLRIEGKPGVYVAEPIRDPSGHDQIRGLLRQKYGLRDWWVALIFDTSRSVAVRLMPQTESHVGALAPGWPSVMRASVAAAGSRRARLPRSRAGD
jgi:hypothetical protein